MKKRLFLFLLFWAVVIPALASVIIMCVWNALVPATFGLTAIGFWQAAVLFVLCQLLSGGFVIGLILLFMGVHGIYHRHNRAAHGRWMQMTDEQRREAFRQRMARFGHLWYDEEDGRTADGHGKEE